MSVLGAIVSSLKLHGVQSRQFIRLCLDGVVEGQILIFPANHPRLIGVCIEEQVAYGDVVNLFLEGNDFYAC